MTPEGLIKRSICEWLETQRCLFWVQQSASVPGRKNNSRFSRNGISDILGVWRGKPMAIEVKSKTGVVSFEQMTFLDDIKKHGGIGIIARSLDDVILRLRSELP